MARQDKGNRVSTPASDPRSRLTHALDLARAGKLPAALVEMDSLIDSGADGTEVRYLRGLFRLQAGRVNGAVDDLRDAVARSPLAVAIRAALASAELKLPDVNAAIRSARCALLLEPANTEAWCDFAGAAILANDFDTGERNARYATIVDPSHGQAWGNRAEALHHMGKTDAAIAAGRQALAVGADTPQARLNLAFSLLSCEQWNEGWPAYKTRLDPSTGDYVRRDHGLPEWTREIGRTKPAVVLAEQGIGEQILFARYLPMLAEQARLAAVEVDAKVLPLLSRAMPELPLIAAKRYRDAWGPRANETVVRASGAECAIEVGTIPAALGSQEPPPSPTGIIQAASDRVEAFRRTLAPKGGPLIGLCWRSKNAAFGGYKSTRLEEWTPILNVGGVNFVNLQYGDVDADIAEATAGGNRHVLRADVDLFDDLDVAAALVAACNLVITTGSTTAQLAGSLGVPMWVLLGRGPGLMWYWGHDEQTPWYPDARLFRQRLPGDWSAPIAEIAEALERWRRTKES